MQTTEIRRAIDPRHAKTMDTTDPRNEFLIEDLVQSDRIHLTYTQDDRMIVGSAVPKTGPLTIDAVKETGTLSWLDQREAVSMNLGTAGSLDASGVSHELGHHDMLYLGMGNGPVTLSGADARFHIVSAPAHRAIPVRLVTIDDAAQKALGA